MAAAEQQQPPYAIEVWPESCLQFTITRDPPGDDDGAVTRCVITLRHPGLTNQHLAFKVKTTHPRRYSVSPGQGVIAPGSSEKLSILINERDRQELWSKYCDLIGPFNSSQSPPLGYQLRDKFMIQSCVISDEFSSKYCNKKSHEGCQEGQCCDDHLINKVLTGMWNDSVANGVPVYKKKLRVHHAVDFFQYCKDKAESTATVELHDIIPDKQKIDTIRRLRDNDPQFTSMWFTEPGDDHSNNLNYPRYYSPVGAYDSGWLGYYVGKSTCLRNLHIQGLDPSDANENSTTRPFFDGVNHNKSIQSMEISDMNLSRGEIFQILAPFMSNNPNLTSLKICDCNGFGDECARQFSRALRNCSNRSLKRINLHGNGIEDDSLAEILLALSTHSELESLNLGGNNSGRNSCMALAALVECTHVHTLDLGFISIDDEMLEALSYYGSKLKALVLDGNRSITSKGWQTLSTCLERSNCNLEELSLQNNGIGTEDAIGFTNALMNNYRLKILNLVGNATTADTWSSFSKLLCDTSSINKTFYSNHTLERIGMGTNRPPGIISLVGLNSNANKIHVAMVKILKNHQDFDLESFFEWDLKVLPIAVAWFERASAIPGSILDFEANMGQRKLSTIYQFIRAMPMMFVKGCRLSNK